MSSAVHKIVILVLLAMPFCAHAIAQNRGVYIIPQQFYPELEMTPLKAAQRPLHAVIVRYESSDGEPITLSMRTTWVGTEEQAPKARQRLVVFDGVIGKTMPTDKWERSGTPIGRNVEWESRRLPNKAGYLSLLPLHLDGKGWTQSTGDFNPSLQLLSTATAPFINNLFKVLYEDQLLAERANRPDIVATLSAPNVVFSIPEREEIERLLTE